MDPKEPPAEAILIRRARQATGLSPERIVERLSRTKMSGRNWRQIEDGRYAPDETLAHMAHAVDVTPERLAETGRTEAAEILRAIEEREALERARAANPTDAELGEMIDDARDDPALYDALMTVWRLRNPQGRGLQKPRPESNDQRDTM